jgi:RNA 3'-terminal phosphate cyclase (ATP)
MTGTARPDEPVLLDGSEGDGGGQLLRSALSLSLLTGRPFHLTRFREHREPPGLRPPHLACVRGAEALSTSTSEGSEVGSTELTFTPGPVRPGDYLLEAGAAGTPLLFQCLFYPLALAGGGRLALRGGTHLPSGPDYHYLVDVWLPMVRAYGLRAGLRLVQAGFTQEGAGEFLAEVLPPEEPPRLVELPARGTLHDIAVSSFVGGGLPFSVAERQSRAAEAALRERGIYCHARNRPLPATRSAGSATFIRAQFEYTLAGFTALGERGRPPEEVGREAAEALARFMEAGGALDEHLAAQILLPAALLAAGRLGPSSPGTTRFTTSPVTEHLLTHARVAERFLPVRVTVEPGGAVEVRPA